MRVLIQGASVAGPVLAYWLDRLGHTPVVVERAERPRLGLGGHAVDLFAPAVTVAERMGLAERLRAARTESTALRLERANGSGIEVAFTALSDAFTEDRHLEILRGELAEILYAATRDRVEYLFGDTVRALDEHGEGVAVGFASGAERQFDLVVGADGLHSGIRRLAFGPDERYRHPLGAALAVATVPDHRRLSGVTLLHTEVDRLVAMYPVGDAAARAVFLFRTDAEPARGDTAAQRELLRSAFAGAGWEVPRLLAAAEHAEDFYLDSIVQVRMDSWSRGRVTLAGDAGYGPGPAVGGGTTLAVVGAYVLARALAGTGGDHRAAFARYEDRLGGYARRCRAVAPGVLRRGIPRSRTAIALHEVALRLLPRLPAALRRAALARGASTTLSEFPLPAERPAVPGGSG